MNLRTLMFLLATLTVAGACAAQDGGRQGQRLDRISYSQYGFELFLPRGSVRFAVPVQAGTTDFTEAFNCGGLGAVIMVPRLDKKESLIANMDALAGQIGLGRTSFKTPQGVDFAGVSGVLALTKEMIQGAPPSLQLRPGMRAKMSVYAADLPSDKTRRLVLVFVGPAERSSEVEDLAQIALDSITFTGLKRADNTTAANTAVSDARSQGLTLSRGQIALKGKVETISPQSKSLTMLADEVVAYGQSAVTLNPARRKIVNYSSLPEDVAVGTRILVIGPNSGTGKPMTAVTIVLKK